MWTVQWWREDLCACESGIETPCKRFTQVIMEMEQVRVEKTTRKVTTLSGFTAVAMERGWMMTVDETYVWTHTQEQNAKLVGWSGLLHSMPTGWREDAAPVRPLPLHSRFFELCTV
jgi:hypothetical protein